MPLDLTRHTDAGSFLAAAGAFLAAREAEHNLIFGLSDRLRRDPLAYGEPAYLATVAADGGPVAAALRTPPHNLVLSECDDKRAVDALLDDLRGDSLPGVLGPKPVAARFARGWRERTGAEVRVAVAERIYRCAEVRPPSGVPGRMRAYAEADRPLALAWLAAFMAEALPGSPGDAGASVLESRTDDPAGGFVLWEDGGPVSLAGFGGPTPNGVRIGPVYTPPERRRRGYAGALTAALTARLLGDGRDFCFLFTNLANPTSNSVYRRIGYEPVADLDQWAFEGGGD